MQAVLLLLGGRELPSSSSNSASTGQEHRVLLPLYFPRMKLEKFCFFCPYAAFMLFYQGGDTPESTAVHRLASLLRFRQKRKERCFEKKVRYGVRKEVAQRFVACLESCVLYKIVLCLYGFLWGIQFLCVKFLLKEVNCFFFLFGV